MVHRRWSLRGFNPKMLKTRNNPGGIVRQKIKANGLLIAAFNLFLLSCSMGNLLNLAIPSTPTLTTQSAFSSAIPKTPALTPTVANTRTLTPAGPAEIYADSLTDGWQDWSWDTTRRLDNPQPVHGGSASIAVTYTAAWGGFYLHLDSGIPAANISAISFWVHGGSAGGQSVNFHIAADGKIFPITVKANTWQLVTVPLAEAGNPETLGDLMWQDGSGKGQPTFYLDDIRLTALNDTPAPATTGAARLPYTGVNLAGAEFDDVDVPGIYNQDYIYPNADEVDYFMSKGMTIIRLPFRWERLQKEQFAEFDAAEQRRMDAIVNYATGKGAYVLIDPHNFARYYKNIIGESSVPVAAFTDFWSRLAGHYRANERVIFGLMNEPNTMRTELWLDDANAAIQAIRDTGAANLILVPGNAWSGAANWGLDWYGTPSAIAMLRIKDSGNNYAFEAHQYMDSDGSGTQPSCVSATIGSQRMSFFTRWLRQNNKRGFLGEFAGGANDTCLKALDDMLTHLEKNSDVYLGWTYWAAGPWWGDYIFTIEPDGNKDRPQMAVLSRHLP